MEIGSIGYLLGALSAIIFVGIGVVFGRISKDDNQRQHGLDTDIRVYVPCRNRHRSRTERVYQPTSEEITDVLRVMRLGASDHEKDVIDYLIRKEEGE